MALFTPQRTFGRKEPTDDKHIRKYSLTRATMPIEPTPVFFGSNWYPSMSEPEQIGRHHYIRKIAGHIEGGHAYCIKPPDVVDLTSWWRKYDQWPLSGCVGWSIARGMSLLNREFYSGEMVYRQALKIDEWPGEADEGTSVRAGLEVVRTMGMWDMRKGVPAAGPDALDGIHEYRWANSVEEVAAVLSPKDNGAKVLNAGYVIVLNSWGIWYPHYVRMDLEVVRRVIFEEYGDAGLVTDKPRLAL
jgi:hypothetical protein